MGEAGWLEVDLFPVRTGVNLLFDDIHGMIGSLPRTHGGEPVRR